MMQSQGPKEWKEEAEENRKMAPAISGEDGEEASCGPEGRRPLEAGKRKGLSLGLEGEQPSLALILVQ